MRRAKGDAVKQSISHRICLGRLELGQVTGCLQSPVSSAKSVELERVGGGGPAEGWVKERENSCQIWTSALTTEP